MSLKKYIVGGWVRDKLLTELGHPIQSNDKDWVVTGATPEEMLRLNFVPIGNDFPVFLHPKTHEEYALARTERKSGHGYKGFTFFADPSVTLEQDLLRRDLTVNAMAMDEEGHLIDPYGGFEDLKKGVLRHVSAAFEEDPLRVLRVSRFRAKLPWFRIAEETKAMLKRMVESGEVDALVPERVTAEIRKALKEAKPSIFFDELETNGFMGRVYPEWKQTELSREPTVEEIAADMHIDRMDVVLALEAIQDPVSLFEPVCSDGSDALCIVDQVKDERVRDEDWVQDIAISDAMGHLNEREKKILRMRFFEGRTQMEVAGEIGISQAQVSRLEKHALMNMRKHLGE